MSDSFKKKFTATRAGILLLLLCALALPFLTPSFGAFYSGSWQEYKIYFPRFYFLIFPAVKIFPFAIIALLLWLLRKRVTQLKAALSWLSLNKAGIFLFCISTAVILFCAEYALRKKGNTPGQLYRAVTFRTVDSLILLEGYTTDSNGVFKIAPAAREWICTELIRKDCIYELSPPLETQSHEVYSVPLHFVTLLGYHYKSDFKDFLLSIRHAPPEEDAPFVEAVKSYIECPVNEDGFRSLAFKKYTGKRKSILLLGDSFTWGFSASNLTNSFADLLLTKGYVVYNTGIAGADPAQYLELARTLTPLLRPDFVVVNFYLGNDVMHFERKPNPDIPIFYCTNAGNLISCPDGISFNSAQQAYDYSLANIRIPQNGKRFNTFCSATALGTCLWKITSAIAPALKHSPYDSYYREAEKLQTKKPYSNEYLSQIRSIADENGSAFLLIAIPMFDGNAFRMPQDYPYLFENLPYHVPAVRKAHYDKIINGHYNDAGHFMHAEFIDSLLETFADKP